MAPSDTIVAGATHPQLLARLISGNDRFPQPFGLGRIVRRPKSAFGSCGRARIAGMVS